VVDREAVLVVGGLDAERVKPGTGFPDEQKRTFSPG
jgi:hypothetical protein